MNYHNITKNDMKNGDGLRVVLWVSGCSHKCKGCHNPITWDPNGGIEFDDSAKQELYEELDKEYISGITFSGGDPLNEANRTVVGDLINEISIKYPQKTIWLYTGFLFEDIENLPFIKNIDVICDGKFILEKRDVSLPWVGSPNQRVIDVKKSLINKQICLHNSNNI